MSYMTPERAAATIIKQAKRNGIDIFDEFDRYFEDGGEPDYMDEVMDLLYDFEDGTWNGRA